jgi:uncharacterized protein YjbI with pentapeptide repeats
MAEAFERIIDKFDWVLFFVGMAFGLSLYALVVAFLSDFGELMSELAPEIFGIAFTVLFIERLGKARQERQHIKELSARIHSRYNATALQALEEMRALYKDRLQWVDMDTYTLRDELKHDKQAFVSSHNRRGVLAGAQLRGSQWQDANFYQVDLRGSDLRKANFLGADLVGANLEGAQVAEEQLATCDIMMSAIMPDGELYDGRYLLPGDFVQAQQQGHNPNDAQSMADWFGVSLEVYMRGQQYWQDNKHRFKVRSKKYSVEDVNNASWH